MVFELLPTWGWLLLLFFVTIFFVGGAITSFIVYQRFKWPILVTILEKVPPFGYIPTMNDRARIISFGDGGEEIVRLKKAGKYRVSYGRKIGNKKIAFAIGEDGYWYNVVFGDFDKKLGEIGVLPVDRDMRLANSAIRKGIENRYSDKSFFEKWGVAITIGMLVIAILIQAGGTWFNHTKSLEVSRSNLEVAKVNKETMESTNSIIGKLNILQQGGSGISPIA